MEPRIQYAKTKDGVSIAYYTMGEGMPLVEMVPWTHLQLEWQLPEYRSWFERLAEKRMVVRYDGRGTGLSERDITDLSLEARMLDLEAVVDRLGLETPALLALHYEGPVAIAYAARHPEQVSRLILWCSFARASDAASPRLRGLGRLLDTNWELYTETVAHAIFGWSESEGARLWAAIMREGLTREEARAGLDAMRQWDVTDLLPNLSMPTLVLHRRQAPFPDVRVAKQLAATIRDARLALLEGASGAPFIGDTDAVLTAIDEFLGEEEEATAASEAPEPSAFRTILFTDVEGSTALTQRLGDAKARELLREHERIVREALKSHGGSEVKTMGDGFMASFSTATKALECAIAMQRAFAAHNESAEEPIMVRVGLNAGEPIAEDDDLFGTAVNLAARICANAEAGQILAPIVVRELAAGKQFMFADLGETELRGFEDPVRLYELRWREAG